MCLEIPSLALAQLEAASNHWVRLDQFVSQYAHAWVTLDCRLVNFNESVRDWTGRNATVNDATNPYQYWCCVSDYPPVSKSVLPVNSHSVDMLSSKTVWVSWLSSFYTCYCPCKISLAILLVLPSSHTLLILTSSSP